MKTPQTFASQLVRNRPRGRHGLALLIALTMCSVGGSTRVRAQARLCDDITTPKRLDDLIVRGQCVTRTVGPSNQPHETLHQTTREAQVGDRVVVLVDGLARLQAAGTPAGTGASAPTAVDWSHALLFLDGQPLKGVNPLSVPDSGHSDLEFRLTRDPGNRDAWIGLLGGAIRQRPVRLSVGFEGQPPLRTEVDNFQLIAIPTPWLWTWIGLCSLVLGLLLWTGRTSNILRAVGVEPSGSAPAAGGGAPVAQAQTPKKPFSLARTQMAFWFFIVLAAYVFIWLVTGQLDVLTSSVLGLIGISAATGVAGNTIDAGRQAGANPPPALQSSGFFTDILSDDHGVSLARVQIAIWTVVLGIIFSRSVYQDLAMPQFDATLLGLMGISNGTYVGFKGLER
jgi:hypothetical protein